MKPMIITLDEIHLGTRKTWGQLKPYSRTFKSKKDYNRRDKSWKKDMD